VVKKIKGLVGRGFYFGTRVRAGRPENYQGFGFKPLIRISDNTASREQGGKHRSTSVKNRRVEKKEPYTARTQADIL